MLHCQEVLASSDFLCPTEIPSAHLSPWLSILKACVWGAVMVGIATSTPNLFKQPYHYLELLERPWGDGGSRFTVGLCLMTDDFWSTKALLFPKARRGGRRKITLQVRNSKSAQHCIAILHAQEVSGREAPRPHTYGEAPAMVM